MLGNRGIKLEELPPAEDIKKLERKVARDEKKIEQVSQKLPKKNKKTRFIILLSAKLQLHDLMFSGHQ